MRSVTPDALLVLAAACGSHDDKKADPAPKSVGEQAAATADIARLPLGVAKPADFNYSSGKAEKAFRPVAEAYKKKD